jgi:hypothetical protein
MRARVIRNKGAASFEELKPLCEVLILHEDASSYSCAVEVCRKLMERFSSELDFGVKCWNVIELAVPNCARHAAKTAGAANIILISVSTSFLPLELERWLDYYFISRFRPDGALVLVLNSSKDSELALEKCTQQLERSAQKLGMDFISLFPFKNGASMDLKSVAIRSAAMRA